MINENVQQEPATSYDVELAGQLAAIGIVHGKPFKPDARMKKILTDAADVRQCGRPRAELALFRVDASRLVLLRRLDVGQHALGRRLHFFETPPPMITKEGMFKPYPADRRPHARFADRVLLRLHARLARHDHAHSRCRLAVSDGFPRLGQEPLRRRQDLQGDACRRDIPAARSGRSPSTTTSRVRCSTRRSDIRAPAVRAILTCSRGRRRRFDDRLLRPDAARRCQTWQLDPDRCPSKGWFTILRLYSPLNLSSPKNGAREIELVK